MTPDFINALFEFTGAMPRHCATAGPGWIGRDRRLAALHGADPDRWWCHVENKAVDTDDEIVI